MVNEDIFEGLKVGVSRGEPLSRAVQSFYNAGYPKNEVDEAAHFLQSYGGTNPNIPQQQPMQQKQQMPQPPKTQQVPSQPPIQNQQPSQQPVQKPKTQNVQNVSNYELKKPYNNALIAGIIIALVILLGTLVSLVMFREQLVQMLNSLFG